MVAERWSGSARIPAAAPLKVSIFDGHFPGFAEAKRHANEIRRRVAEARAAARAEAPATQQPSQSALIFDGPDQSATNEIPPDSQVAAGPNNLVVVVNSLIAIYDKSGNAQGTYQLLSGFFASLGVAGEIFDPRIIYDPAGGHFILSAAAVDLQNFSSGNVVLAVSATSDPTGVWYKYEIDSMGVSSTGQPTFPDFPTLGISSSAVYVSTSQFALNAACVDTDEQNCQFSDTWIDAIGLGPFLAGDRTLTVTTFKNVQTPSGGPAFAIEPAVTYGSAPEEFLVAADFGSLPSKTIDVFGINTSGTPVLSSTAVSLSSPVGLPPDAIQPGSQDGIGVVPIDTDDFRLLGAVWVNGSIWCGQNAASSDGAEAVAQWYELSATSLSSVSVAQSGTISGSGDAYYPAIAVKPDGEAEVAFTTSSATQNPAAAYSGRSAADAAGTMRGFGIFKPGTATYSLGEDSRWGDYSGASLDPSGSSIWLMGEYAKQINVYGTAIAQVNGPPDVVSSLASLDFGTELIGATTPAQTFTLTNPGASPLVMGTLALSGANASDFAIAGDNCSDATLAAGAACAVKLTFTPSIDGSESANLSVPSASAGLPQLVLLKGTGVTISQAVSLSPGSLTFANQAIRSVSAAQTVTVTSLVKSPLSILSLSVFSPFAQTNTCVQAGGSGTLPPGGSCTISVTFRPIATGAVSSSVSVNLLTQGGGIEIPVNGTGVEAPAVTLCPTTLSFGSQAVGTASAPQTITISNTGSSTLTISSISATAGFSIGPTCGPGTAIPPRSACSVPVSFTPSTAGNAVGTLSVSDNAAASPQTVALQGTGLAAASEMRLPAAVKRLMARSLTGPAAANVSSRARSGSAILTALTKLPLRFEPNVGKIDPRFPFLLRGGAYRVFLSPDSLVLELGTQHGSGAPSDGTTLSLKFVGSDSKARMSGQKRLSGVTNYFIGNDPARWHTHVPSFAQVESYAVYKNVDVVYYGRRGRLEYDIDAAPKTNPRKIRLELQYRDSALQALKLHRARRPVLRLTRDGGIEIGTGKRILLLAPPVAYQPDSKARNRKRLVRCRYVIHRRHALGESVSAWISFRLGAYDHSAALIIDPVLSYSTFLGGSGNDVANAIALDSAGDAFIAGKAGSPDFPAPGAIEPHGLGEDAFITKLSPDGSHVLYSTFLGGSGDDAATGIALDAAGNIYVTGTTDSKNFPLASAFQTAYRGNEDAFVAKISADGSKLVYSSYLGGSQYDAAAGIAVDGAGNAYVAGITESVDFPTTPGAFQTVAASTASTVCYAGGFQGCVSNAFVAKIASNGSLSYSTLLGGHQSDDASGIAVDPAGDAYVVGSAGSDDFPVTPGAYQTAAAALSDAFVAKLSPDGTHLLYSTYLGGGPPSDDFPGYENSGNAIAIDSTGAAFVTGTTESPDFPTTASSASEPTFHSTFVTKLHPAGCAVEYSYKFSAIFPESISLDSHGDAYVTGVTQEGTDLANPIQSSCVNCQEGASKAFISEINSGGTALAFSTYLGGNSEDQGRGIAVDAGGNVFVAGETASTDFPVLPGAFQFTKPSQPPSGVFEAVGSFSAFVAKISPANSAAAYVIPSGLTFSNQPVDSTSPPQQIDIRDMGSGTLTVSNVTLPAGFSQTNSCNPTPGGGVCAINVTFSPKDTSTVSGVMTVTDNTPTSPHTITLAGSGVDAPYVVLSPSSINFGNVPFGTNSAPQTVTLSNTGDRPLQISGISILDAVSPFSQTNTCPSSLAAGESCSLTITFKPAVLSTAYDSVVISDNAAGGPQVVELRGSGLGGSIFVSYGDGQFGNQGIGTTSAPQIVTLESNGNTPVRISSIGISGAFAETTTCSLNTDIPPGGQCTVSVTFSPTVAGAQTGALTIASNSIGGTIVISTTGTGVAPDFSLSASPTSANVYPGGTATFALALAATGGLTGQISLACSGAPPAGTCSVQPAVLTMGGSGQTSATATVLTAAPAANGATGPIPPTSRTGPSLLKRSTPLLLAFMLVLFWALIRRKQRIVRVTVLGSILALLLLWASCGGGGGSGGGGGGIGLPGTPPGTYTLTVTGTDSGSGAQVKHSVSLTLTVQ